MVTGDEEEEEAEGDEEVEKVRKRKRRETDKEKASNKEKSYELDAEDLDLIEANMGVRVSRPAASRFKRLKKARGEDEELLEEERRALERGLFGDEILDEEEEQEEASEGQAERGAALRPFEVPDDLLEEDEDEMEDFIVQEGGQRPHRSRPALSEELAGVSARALREAAQIFGDFGEYAAAMAGERPAPREWEKRDRQAVYAQVYEPSVLQERFLTAEDDAIRSRDVPERLQLAWGPGGRRVPAEGELAREAEWIYVRAFATYSGDRQAFVQKLQSVLEFMRRDGLETPFIAHYRKDYYREELNETQLWDVQEWDERWARLQQRKSHLRRLLSETLRQQQSAAESSSFSQPSSSVAAEEALTFLEHALREEELSDLHDYVALQQAAQAVALGPSAAAPAPAGGQAGSSHKRPVRRTFYSVCLKAGLGEPARQFGLSAVQFGENLMNNFLTHEPVDHSESPWDLASRYKGPGFADPDTVLKACRYILAQEIAHDPRVRQTLRVIYQDQAEISTQPTPRGKKELDPMHMLFGVKRLDRKPAKEFAGSLQFLEILKAEQAGFITKRIGLSPEDEDTDLREMEKLYLSDRYSAESQAWNEQRRQILREALTQHLYPILERELEHRLASEARQRLAQLCADQFEAQLMMQGWRPVRVVPAAPAGAANPPVAALEYDVDARPRVLGCVWGGTAGPSAFAVVDEEGEVLETLRLGSLGLRADERASEGERAKREADLRDLRALIERHHPRVYALAAQPAPDGGVESQRLLEDLKKLAQDLRREPRRRAAASSSSSSSSQQQDVEEEEDEDAYEPVVTWVDGEASALVARSERGAQDLGDMPGQLRQAVWVARYCQDPLEVLCTLLADGSEQALGLRLHPLQDMLPRDQLLKALEQRAVRVVNRVGIDLNRCLQHRHASAPLQFVCGLGPRKASALLQALSRAGKVRSREELEPLLGSAVFFNAAGFLRVRAKYLTEEDEVELLDDTRVHPDDYGFARKMAADALEAQETDGEAMQRLLRDIMADPAKLDDIDLDSFAEEWEKKGKSKKRLTLYDIKAELTRPYADPRGPWHGPPADRLFSLLSGETEWSLQPGMLVTARVVRTFPTGAMARLEGSGLSAWIDRDDLSDQPVERVNENVRPGMLVHARVLDIKREELRVRLTCKNSELRNPASEVGAAFNRWWQDPYLRPDSPVREGEEEAVRARQKQRARSKGVKYPRVISHPAFQNWTAEEAQERLRDRPDLDYVFRPSSKGYDHLTLTWKFFRNILVHFDILEEQKTKPYELGRVLVLGREKYDELDELIARYMDPLVANAREVMSHRMYRDGTEEEVDALLAEEKARQPSRIPYFISVSHRAPGRFVLSYLPHVHPRHEIITPTPVGIRFRGHIFQRTEDLIQWFKKHYSQRPPPSRR